MPLLRKASSPKNSSGKIKVCFFDFDLTISTIHMFQILYIFQGKLPPVSEGKNSPRDASPSGRLLEGEEAEEYRRKSFEKNQVVKIKTGGKKSGNSSPNNDNRKQPLIVSLDRDSLKIDTREISRANPKGRSRPCSRDFGAISEVGTASRSESLLYEYPAGSEVGQMMKLYLLNGDPEIVKNSEWYHDTNTNQLRARSASDKSADVAEQMCVYKCRDEILNEQQKSVLCSELKEQFMLKYPAYFGVSFAYAVLGNSERVKTLKVFFKTLVDRGIELYIITRGYVGPVRMILDYTGLNVFFDDVYGSAPGTYQDTTFDTLMNVEDFNNARTSVGKVLLSSLVGTPETTSWSNKADIIQQVLKKKNLQASEALFVEDDEMELSSTENITRGFMVESGSGLTSSDLEQILAMA